MFLCNETYKRFINCLDFVKSINDTYYMPLIIGAIKYFVYSFKKASDQWLTLLWFFKYLTKGFEHIESHKFDCVFGVCM